MKIHIGLLAVFLIISCVHKVVTPAVTRNTSSDTTNLSPPPINTKKITVSWTANKEKAVNSLGGGYKVSYSTNSSFLSGVNTINVPYVNGLLSPTSVQINQLTPGFYYLKVKAFSPINQGSVESNPISIEVK